LISISDLSLENVSAVTEQGGASLCDERGLDFVAHGEEAYDPMIN
jgi:hypothetical protein